MNVSTTSKEVHHVTLDDRVPVYVIKVDGDGTALIEFYNGERRLWSFERLLSAECYRCKKGGGAMVIVPYGSTGRLRCIHDGPCSSEGGI
jgi:hypothetical protein